MCVKACARKCANRCVCTKHLQTPSPFIDVREAKVDDFHTAVLTADEDVVGLEVAVDDLREGGG